MKRAVIALIALSFAAPAVGQVRVKGYVKSDGTYVAPHYRSTPDSTPNNNYSTRPNVNPYTGATGTKPPSYTPYTPPRAYRTPCYFNCPK